MVQVTMSILNQLQLFIKHQTHAFGMLLKLISLETKLAGLTIAPLLVCISLFMIVGLTVWLSSMSLFAYGVNQITHSPWMAIFSIFILKIALMIILAVKLLRYKKDISFSKTRAYFSNPTHEPLNE